MMRVIFGGKRWEVQIGPAPPGDHGVTEHPKRPGKRIVISDAIDDDSREFLETAIHEALHAADWSKDEEWVQETAADLSRFLWRLGFRKME